MCEICKRKITEKKGFTLAESLVAILIMLMVSSILAAGIPAARNAYEKVVLRSNAEMALSTAIYALRNEMSVATDISLSKGNSSDSKDSVVEYQSGTFGSASKISVDNSNGIMYQRFKADNNDTNTRLVSEGASDNKNGLYVKYKSVKKEKNYITFEGLNVYKTGREAPIFKKDRDVSITTF